MMFYLINNCSTRGNDAMMTVTYGVDNAFILTVTINNDIPGEVFVSLTVSNI